MITSGGGHSTKHGRRESSGVPLAFLGGFLVRCCIDAGSRINLLGCLYICKGKYMSEPLSYTVKRTASIPDKVKQWLIPAIERLEDKSGAYDSLLKNPMAAALGGQICMGIQIAEARKEK